MKSVSLFLLLLVMPTVVWADLQSDMMADKIKRLENEMTLLQKKVYTQDSDQLKASKKQQRRSFFSFGDDESISNEAVDELLNQIEQQSTVIADLTKRIEEMSFEQKMLKEKLQLLSDDTQIRFQQMEGNIRLAEDKVTEQPEKEIKQENVADNEKTEPLTDKEAYNQAYDILMQGDYVQAEQAFTDFLKTYPESSLAGNASYWLGETYYVRGEYEVAAGVFSESLEKYENGPKAPDNLLKLGLIMAHLGNKEEACGFFTLLQEKYPKANAALKQRTEEELKKLSCLS